MADAPPVSDAGNAPDDRTDPKAGKGPLGISWLMWGIVAVGTFGVVWFLRSQSSGTSASTTSATTGALAGTDPNSGVTLTDPMTASALLQAMSDLVSQNSTLIGKLTPGNSPAPTPPDAGGAGDPPISSVVAKAGTAVGSGLSYATSRLTGGSSTAITAVPTPSSPNPQSSIMATIAGVQVPGLTLAQSQGIQQVITPVKTTTVVKAPVPSTLAGIAKRIISGPVAPKTVTTVSLPGGQSRSGPMVGFTQ